MGSGFSGVAVSGNGFSSVGLDWSVPYVSAKGSEFSPRGSSNTEEGDRTSFLS